MLKIPIYGTHTYSYQANELSPFLEVDFHQGYTPYKIPKRRKGVADKVKVKGAPNAKFWISTSEFGHETLTTGFAQI